MDQDASIRDFQEALEQNRRDVVERRRALYAEHGTFISPNRKAYLEAKAKEHFKAQRQRKG